MQFESLKICQLLSVFFFFFQIWGEGQADVHKCCAGPHRAPGVLLLLPALRRRLQTGSSTKETRRQKGL